MSSFISAFLAMVKRNIRIQSFFIHIITVLIGKPDDGIHEHLQISGNGTPKPEKVSPVLSNT